MPSFNYEAWHQAIPRQFPRLYIDTEGTSVFLMCVHGDGKVETVARFDSDDEALGDLLTDIFDF